MRAEEVITLLLVLPGFGDVDGYPSAIARVKLRPAVIAGNFALALVRRKRKPDLEPAGDLLRARHRDKERMKVGTVAPLRVARPESVAVSPAGAGLVIAHVGQRVIVERACLL